MSLFGTPAIQAAAGINQAERAVSREAEKRKSAARAAPGKPAATRGHDELDLQVQTAEADDAVRGLSGNGREETAEDRQKQDGYRPQTKRPADAPARPPLDLSA